MNPEFFVISLLNGVSYGLLLFMLSSGLTLIFSMMGVLNFAHTSFYMLGAYFAYTISGLVGFWPALVIAPLLVFVLGAAFERYCLRRVHKFGHVPELLVTFGLSYLILEVVQLVWGRAPLAFDEACQLENYARAYGIHRKKWLAPFQKGAAAVLGRGFVAWLAHWYLRMAGTSGKY